MEEEKQLQNPQGSETAEVSSNTVEYVETRAMSAEPNLPTDSDAQAGTPIAASSEQTTGTEEQFTLDAEVEPFDLSPDASTGETVSAEQVASLKAALDEQTQRLEALKSQLEDREVQYKRLGADFENYRKRVQREKEEQEQAAKCVVVKELLPAIDNFERARAQIKPQTDSEMNIHKSYQSVYKQLVDSLKKIGVSPMRSEGKEFDPNLHEAVMREATNEFPEGTVIEELMRGYMLGERVLRHAMVKVAAPAEESDSGATSSSEAESTPG